MMASDSSVLIAPEYLEFLSSPFKIRGQQELLQDIIKSWKREYAINNVTPKNLKDLLQGNRAIVTTKVDGELGLLHYNKGAIDLISITGRLLSSLPCLDEAADFLANSGIETATFICELAFLKKDLSKEEPYLNSLDKLKEPTPDEEGRIGIFLIQWLDGPEDYLENLDDMSDIFDGGTLVKVVEYDYGNLRNVTDMWNKNVVKNNSEGLVIHHKDKIYKMKPEMTADVCIIAVKPVKTDETKMGALIVAFFDGDAYIEAGTIGSGKGWDERVRTAWMAWALEHQVPGPDNKFIWVEPDRVIEVKYDGATEEDGSPAYTFSGGYSDAGDATSVRLNQPRMIGLRDDKDPTSAHDLRLDQVYVEEPEAIEVTSSKKIASIEYLFISPKSKLGAYAAALISSADEEISTDPITLQHYMWDELLKHYGGYILDLAKTRAKGNENKFHTELWKLKEEIWNEANKTEKALNKEWDGMLSGQAPLKRAIEYFDLGYKGKNWYTRAREVAEEYFEDAAPLFLKIVAALSPRTNPDRNIKEAIAVMEAFIKEEQLPGKTAPGKPQNAWRPNVVRALVSLPLSGPKVTNFYKALMGDPEAVCIDSWMARVFLGVELDTAISKISDKQYLFIEQLVKQVADQINKEPSNVTNSDFIKYVEAQAAIWAGARRKFYDTQQQKKKEDQDIDSEKEMTELDLEDFDTILVENMKQVFKNEELKKFWSRIAKKKIKEILSPEYRRRYHETIKSEPADEVKHLNENIVHKNIDMYVTDEYTDTLSETKVRRKLHPNLDLQPIITPTRKIIPPSESIRYLQELDRF